MGVFFICARCRLRMGGTGTHCPRCRLQRPIRHSRQFLSFVCYSALMIVTLVAGRATLIVGG